MRAGVVLVLARWGAGVLLFWEQSKQTPKVAPGRERIHPAAVKAHHSSKLASL